ncbi:MAG: glycosyltransferase family A protein [Kiritimatiellales bacterium]
MSCAIIMRSKNEMPYVVTALDRLARQTWQDYTLYTVDSGSTDGTLEVVQRANPERLTEIASGSYIPGKVLNDMIAKTSADLIVFLNADAIPLNEFWLERLLRPILDGTADATMSKQLARSNAYFIVDYDYRRAYDPRNIKQENEDFFSAVACAFKRSLWERVKFPVTGYAEDLAWAKECREQGARFQLLLDSQVEHSHNYTIKELYRKKYRHGLTYHRMYGQRPHGFAQTVACLRELIRDGLYACIRLKPWTIPYNIAYRTVIHSAIHSGLKAAVVETDRASRNCPG